MDELINLLDTCTKTTGCENLDAIDKLVVFVNYQFNHNTEVLDTIKAFKSDIFSSKLGAASHSCDNMTCKAKKSYIISSILYLEDLL